jgi:L-methionine (R)-S-oxide reductase
MSDVYAEFRTILSSSLDRVAKARALAEALQQAKAYHWVGLYDVMPAQIRAIAWTGDVAPAFPSFPRSLGLNGAAVASGRPLVVQDVTQDPRWLTTFGTSKAEVIFPVTLRGAIVGTIDIESERMGPFTKADEKFLTDAAKLMRPLWEARRWAKEGFDDWNKSASFFICASARRSTSSLDIAMQNHVTRLLTQLDSLKRGDGVRRAKLLSRVLFVVGLLLAAFVGVAIAYGLHPAFIAVPAAAVGWVIAERNALRLRISQWPIMRSYIDWQRVQVDLPHDV